MAPSWRQIKGSTPNKRRYHLVKRRKQLSSIEHVEMQAPNDSVISFPAFMAAIHRHPITVLL
jgi:hypothetical protein